MKPRLLQQGVQQQVLAQVLQQSLQILQMPLLELKGLIEQELESNPVLEEAELSESRLARSRGPAEIVVTGDGPDLDRLVRLAHHGRESTNLWETMEGEDDEDGAVDPLSTVAQPPPTLDEVLLRQLAAMALPGAVSQAAEAIVGSLDDAGYLRESLETLTTQLQVPLAIVQQGLAAVHQCEPVGVGARSLEECLLLQLNARGLEHSLAARILKEGGLEELGQRQFGKLARRFSCPLEEVEQAAQTIASLVPQPGHLARERDQLPAVIPDLVITRSGDGRFHATLRDDELPSIRISPTYRRMLEDPSATDEVRTFVRDRVQAALAVLRGIQQRQRTMHRLAEALIKLQPAFLEHGLSTLKPMTHKQVAEQIGRHPSTVARAVAHKYVECPAGVYALADLFSASLSAEQGDSVSAQSVRTQMRELVVAEDRRTPFSDAAIVEHMQGLGIRLARRTVAKYRQQLKIPSAHQRRLKSA